MPILLDDAVHFFQELEADNSREFWQRERHRYDRAIRPTFLAIVEPIDRFGPWRLYRPHNDTRFATAKGPYKTFIGAVAERPDGVGAFVQVSARGVLVGTGMPMAAPDQLVRLRSAIADDGAGPGLVDAIDDATGRGITVHGGRWDPLRRVPRGFPSDHPRAALLRWKGIEANRRIASPEWADVDDAVAEVRRLLDEPAPLHRWLGHEVGPSSMTAEERFAPRRRSEHEPAADAGRRTR